MACTCAKPTRLVSVPMANTNKSRLKCSFLMVTHGRGVLFKRYVNLTMEAYIDDDFVCLLTN